MKGKVVEGTVISIPFDDTYAVCKVLYVSSYFNNIMLLKVFSTRLAHNNSYSLGLESSTFDLIYTGTTMIKNGEWPILGTEPLSKLEQGASKRIVGGDVWVSDECIGPASNQDMEKLPKMKVFNVKFVEDKASKFPVQSGT